MTFASKGGLQLLELFEVRLSLCAGAEARMNRVLYIGYICYLLRMLSFVYDLAADHRNWTNTISLSLTFLFMVY